VFVQKKNERKKNKKNKQQSLQLAVLPPLRLDAKFPALPNFSRAHLSL